MSAVTIDRTLFDLSNIGSELTSVVTEALSSPYQTSLPEQLTFTTKVAVSSLEDFANIARDFSLNHFGLFSDILRLINASLMEFNKICFQIKQELNVICFEEDWKEGAKAFLSTYNGAVAHANDLKREFVDGYKKKIKYYASSLLTDLEAIDLDSLQKGRGAQIQIADALHEAGKNSLKLSKYVNDFATTSGLPRDEYDVFSKTLSQKAQEVVNTGNLVLQSSHNHDAVLKLTIAIQSLKNELRNVNAEPGNSLISQSEPQSKYEEIPEYQEQWNPRYEESNIVSPGISRKSTSDLNVSNGEPRSPSDWNVRNGEPRSPGIVEQRNPNAVRNGEPRSPGGSGSTVYRHFCVRCLESFATLWSLTRHEKMVPDCTTLRSTKKSTPTTTTSTSTTAAVAAMSSSFSGSPRLARPRASTTNAFPNTPPLVTTLRAGSTDSSPYRPLPSKTNSDIDSPLQHKSTTVPTFHSPQDYSLQQKSSTVPTIHSPALSKSLPPRTGIPPLKIQSPTGLGGGAGGSAGSAAQSPQLSPRNKPSWKITSIVVAKKPENLPFPVKPSPSEIVSPPSDWKISESETVDLNQTKSELDFNQPKKGTNDLAPVGVPPVWTAAAFLDDINYQLQVLKEAVIRAVRVSTFNSYEVKQQLPLTQYTSENPKITHPEINSDPTTHVCGNSTLYLVEHNTYPGHPLMMNLIVNYSSEVTCLAHHYEGESGLMTHPDRLPVHPNILRTYHHFVGPVRVAGLPGWTLTPLDAEMIALCVVMPYAPVCLEELVIAQRRKQNKNDHPTNGVFPPLFDHFVVHLWLRQLLRAVEFLHNHRIVHRALSPSTIRFTSRTAIHTPLIAHLGVSLDCNGLDHFELPYPTVHITKGGPRVAYIPPEILGALPGPDAVLPYGVCDEWALGKIIYELVCDEDPYRGKDVRICMQNDYVPLKGTDSTLAAVVEGLLRLDPQKRMSARAALEILS